MNAAFAATSGAVIQENLASQPKSQPSGWDYFEQVLPTAPIICGRPLKPLSIGRYRRMKRQNVAFVADDAENVEKSALVGDLLKAVLICSMTCEDYDAFLEQPEAARQIKRWAQQQGFLPERYYDWPIVGKWFAKYVVGEKVKHLRDERAANYLLGQVDLFQDYIASAQRIPNYSTKQNNPSRHTLHWSNSIELHLRSEQGWATHEIDESPLSKALTDYFGFAESNGMISIHTDKDLETADANAKAVDALLAALAKSEETTKTE